MRLIDADAILEKMRQTFDMQELYLPVHFMDFIIDEMPTIDERKTGEWVQHDSGAWSCSICKSWIPDEQHYYARFCLYCGARMDEEV